MKRRCAGLKSCFVGHIDATVFGDLLQLASKKLAHWIWCLVPVRPVTKENRIYNRRRSSLEDRANEINRKLILEERLEFDAILGEAIIYSVRSATYSMPDAQ